MPMQVINKRAIPVYSGSWYASSFPKTWYSEDKTEITWDMLKGADGDPFVKGEAAEFDCFPLGSTNCSVGEHMQVFVVRRAFVLLVE